MAIHPIMIPAAQAPANVQQRAHLAARADEAADALWSLNLSSGKVGRAPGSPALSLPMPLDQSKGKSGGQQSPVNETPEHRVTLQGQPRDGRSEPRRRDSLKRRDALLRGKEGSRQRRRWENDRLLNNPWAQPPLPADWEVHPTHPRHVVPYYLAPLWDAEAFERSIERKMKARKPRDRAGVGPAEAAASSVPKDVRAKLKQARAAKGLLQDLEEEVREFLHKWSQKESRRREQGLQDIDSEDEEIVFVGRNGQMHDTPTKDDTLIGPERDKLVFQALANDRGASFGRWLVHSIATYYGLRTWSLTIGDPARREAYVGLGKQKWQSSKADLPRPLWAVV